jgi:hypothetical protein
MLRHLLLAIFIIPKLIIWPFLWYLRCRRKQCREEQEQIRRDEAAFPETEITG